MKLEKLTQEQETRMQEIKTFWLDYIMSCENSVNKEQAKIGIDWLYKFAGHNEPIIIHVDSPMGCQIAVNYLKAYVKALPNVLDPDQVRDQVGDQVGDQVWAQVRDQVGDQVGDQVWAQVGAQVWAQVWAQVRDQVGAQVWAQVWAQVRDQVGAQVGAQVWAQVWAQVRDQVGAQVGDQVWAQVWAQVRDQVWDQVRDQVGDQVGDQVWAQVGAQVRAQKLEYNYFAQYGSILDYGWVSFYDFFTEIGVINHKEFNAFKGILTSGIYDMIQLNGFCIVSDLPSSINRDENNKLHSDEGASIEFKDGYKQYYWHGVTVPERWILSPETITKEDVVNEGNAEKRRCIMEILGESKYAQLLDLMELDTDQYNGQEIKLLRTKQKDNLANDFIYFIKVICNSTKREYYLCVPQECCKSAIDALSWTFGMEPDTYLVDIES